MPRRKSPQLNKWPLTLRMFIELPELIKEPTFINNLTKEETREKLNHRNLIHALHATEEAIKKMPLLYQHYGIDSRSNDAGGALALRLAMDFVPGFQVKKETKRGRKDVWNIFMFLFLWVDVQTLVGRNKCSERTACNILLKKDRWKNALEKGKATERGNVPARWDSKSLKTLYNHYMEAKKSGWAKMALRLPKNERLKGLRTTTMLTHQKIVWP